MFALMIIFPRIGQIHCQSHCDEQVLGYVKGLLPGARTTLGIFFWGFAQPEAEMQTLDQVLSIGVFLSYSQWRRRVPAF
jgi:hypothetical protein